MTSPLSLTKKTLASEITLDSIRQTVASALSRRHIALHGLPRTTTPGDVRRLLQRHSIGNVRNVQLEYYNFYPKGTAILTLSGAEHYHDVLAQLQRRLQLYGHTLVAEPTPEPVKQADVSSGDDRQPELLAGNGLQAGIKHVGRSVCILGLPTGTDTSAVRTILESRGFTVDREQHRKQSSTRLWKVHSPTHALSNRYMVNCSTDAEAHRLVQELHMTYHYRHLLQARIIV
ncbi:unnamed protein product [Peniophora sp. CBMAI 1063]|nr:unnamed protein product [Peniophora sp. CBMAI 1063]